MKFIPRKFKNIESNDIVDFEEVVNSSNISVILGEPASGKTYQLKEYTQNNKNSILLKSRYVIKNKTQKKHILLFDSIDEALISYPNIKDDLIDYIEENQDKKFIITCRYLEWKEYFEKELKELDDELKIYEIIALSKKEIDNLLKEEDRKFFWKFIDDNHLESLLKNIMIIFHLVENFRSYDNNSNYVNIYERIVKEYITKIGEDREEEDTNRDLDELVLIASSLATYMILNRLSFISSTNLKKVASECYKIDGKSIIADDLTAVLKTALFEKKGDEFTFFHKSIQEYLTAYFINYKKLDFENIKKLFANKLRFYEEFEEVIIYLTNMNNKLFNDIVNFDPFIFRRHLSLTKEQQKQLLISVLDKVQNEEWMINSFKGTGIRSQSRWRVLNGSSIFKYCELTDKEVYEIIINHIDKNPISVTTFTYLIKLLEFKYSKEVEDFLFLQLEKISSSEQVIYIINGFIQTKTFVKEYSFNKRLFSFIVDNFIDRYNEHNRKFQEFMITFFHTLYVKNNNIDFKIIQLIFRHISEYDFSRVIPYLEVKDIEKFFNYESILSIFNTHHLEWFMFILLKNKKYKEAIKFLEENHFIERRTLYHPNFILSFSEIDKELFLLLNRREEKNYNIVCRALSFYHLSEENIKGLIKKYPIEDFLDFYICLSKFFKIILHLLKKNESYYIYLENRKKR